MIYFKLTAWTGWSQLRECAPAEVDGWIEFARLHSLSIELWNPAV